MADLIALAEEIRLLEDEARAAQRRPIEIAIAIGEHLLTAKTLVPHGEFIDWVAADCGYTQRHAQYLMRVAANAKRVSHLDQGISLRGAIAAIDKALRAEQLAADLGDWTDEELALRQTLESGKAILVNYERHQRLIAWAEEAGLLVRIDRKSIWGNPYVLDEDGNRAEVIANYRDHYLDFKPSLLMRIGDDLEGKALACWCAPEPCHGDVLLYTLEGLLIQESMPSHAGVLLNMLNEKDGR
jgi:hypothetical protein